MLEGIQRPVKPEEVLVISGTTMVCDLLSHVLLDEDSVLLAHSPLYHRFLNDFGDRGLIELVPVPTVMEGATEAVLNVDLFKSAHQKAISEVNILGDKLEK